jgi:hypothetical protein
VWYVLRGKERTVLEDGRENEKERRGGRQDKTPVHFITTYYVTFGSNAITPPTPTSPTTPHPPLYSSAGAGAGAGAAGAAASGATSRF